MNLFASSHPRDVLALAQLLQSGLGVTVSVAHLYAPNGAAKPSIVGI